MEYVVRIFFDEKRSGIYAYGTEIYAKDIMEASEIVARHISNFKKSAKINVGIYIEDKLVAGYTSTSRDWFFINDDEWILLKGGNHRLLVKLTKKELIKWNTN